MNDAEWNSKAAIDKRMEMDAKRKIKHDSKLLLNPVDDKDIDYWSTDWESEQLHCESIEEALEEYADNDEDSEGHPPEFIEVYGYQRMQIHPQFDDVLTNLLESLDSDYGNPDGDGTQPTPAMLAAEAAFVEVMKKEYQVWTCECVKKKIVKVSDYFKKEDE